MHGNASADAQHPPSPRLRVGCTSRCRIRPAPPGTSPPSPFTIARRMMPGSLAENGFGVRKAPTRRGGVLDSATDAEVSTMRRRL